MTTVTNNAKRMAGMAQVIKKNTQELNDIINDIISMFKASKSDVPPDLVNLLTVAQQKAAEVVEIAKISQASSDAMVQILECSDITTKSTTIKYDK